MTTLSSFTDFFRRVTEFFSEIIGYFVSLLLSGHWYLYPVFALLISGFIVSIVKVIKS